MKKSNTPIKKQLMLLVAALFLAGAAFSQNTTITDVSSHTADASAVLDIHSTSLGMLVPRLSAAPSSPATGLLYYHSTNNHFNYYDGSNWKTMAITDEIHWEKVNPGEITTKVVSDFVGIGTRHPGTGLATWLTVRDVVGTYPQFHILTNVNTADASMKYSIWDGEKAYTHGIFNDPNNSATYNFKICNTGSLTGPGYTDPNTMLEIHDEDFSANGVAGIIDFNHQSRAKVFQLYMHTLIPPSTGQFIPFDDWTMVEFDTPVYDEHSEWTLAAPGIPTEPSFFTATETGYYQVNSRVDFILSSVDNPEEPTELLEIHNPNYPGYVSIAIFVSTDGGTSWGMYAQGNKLQGTDNYSGWTDLRNNLAPNVSDVVYLEAGYRLRIEVYQNLSNANPSSPYEGIPLRLESQPDKNGTFGGSDTQCYVSIHKIS